MHPDPEILLAEPTHLACQNYNSEEANCSVTQIQTGQRPLCIYTHKKKMVAQSLSAF